LRQVGDMTRNDGRGDMGKKGENRMWVLEAEIVIVKKEKSLVW